MRIKLLTYKKKKTSLKNQAEGLSPDYACR